MLHLAAAQHGDQFEVAVGALQQRRASRGNPGAEYRARMPGAVPPPVLQVAALDGDDRVSGHHLLHAVRGYLLEQDREISEKSGRPPLAIKSISRIGAKKK